MRFRVQHGFENILKISAAEYSSLNCCIDYNTYQGERVTLIELKRPLLNINYDKTVAKFQSILEVPSIDSRITRLIFESFR